MKKIILGGITAGFVLLFWAGTMLAVEQDRTLVKNIPGNTVPASAGASVTAQISTGPGLKIFSPMDRTIVYQQKIIVKGMATVKDPRVNGTAVNVDSKDRFSALVTLKPGKNTIIAKARDSSIYNRVLLLPKFSDLNAGHFAKMQLETMSLLGYFSVIGKKIRPDQSISRVEMAALLTRIAAIPVEDIKQSTTSLFKDVNAKTPCAECIYAVAKQKLMPGFEDGTFRPTVKISRADALALLVRAAGLKSAETQANTYFKDIPRNYWAAPLIDVAIAKGIVRSGGNFYPEKTLTRAELATWLSQLPEIKKEVNDLLDWSKGYELEENT
jgi:hypothetical protein